jgi:hypothetical protein
MAELLVIKATYTDGRLALEHEPNVPVAPEVIVTFIKESEPRSRIVPTQMRRGIFAGPKRTTLADFRDAEFHDGGD